MKHKYKNIILGLSKKSDGPMNIRFPEIDKACMRNRKIFLAKIGINYENVVSAQLVHKTNIFCATEKDKGRILYNTDGLITETPQVFLTVTVADCLPIYAIDTKRIAAGIAHAGWKGILKKMPIKLVECLQNKFNSNLRNIKIYIGPHLQRCHFEVQEDVASLFDKDYIYKENKKIKIDLLKACVNQLIYCGILPKNIYTDKECTYCSKEKYFSFRRDKPKKVQSMLAYIGIINK